MSEERFGELLKLADTHHVTMRALRVIENAAAQQQKNQVQRWCEQALKAEGLRITNAVEWLRAIVNALQDAGCPVSVIKSLDHWPDLGNDLDLLSTGDKANVVRVFTQKLGARIEARSWGDRLASKWNFSLPDLRESIEAHIGRLGQTGEHKALAERFIDRRIVTQVNGYEFLTPAPEERIFAATLQRMYRHFYFRVCDILNAASLVESGKVNFAELRDAAEQAGIWIGVASFLNIISEYVKQYRGSGLNLPAEVIADATLHVDKMYTRARFLRIPILPYAARLYARQLTETAFRGNVPATLRLSLLPPLASAAAVAFRITGSDKGVW